MKHITRHYFEIVLCNVYEDTPGLEDALFEAGCDDALLYYKNNIVCLSFDRKASDLEAAIRSAICSIENAPIQAKVHHIEGAFLTLSDIAERVGITKQAISLYVKGERGKGKFPVPFSGVNSASPIWRFSEVLQWLYEQNKIQGKEQLLNDAKIIDKINTELQSNDNNCMIRPHHNPRLRLPPSKGA